MLLFSDIITRERFHLDEGVHPLDALLFLISGSFWCRINGTEAIVHPGELFAFPKDMPFQRKVLSPIRGVYLQYDALPPKVHAGILRPADSVRAENSLRYMEQLAALDNNSELLEHFVRDLLLTQTLRSAAAAGDDIARQCYHYMETHFAEDISLEALAERYALTPHGLIGKCKRQFGQTPMALLKEIRLQQSRQLLKDTALPIGQIAEACGLKNVYYYSNTFKKRYGLSPSEFRRSMLL